VPAQIAPGSKNVLLVRSLRLCVLKPKAPNVDPKSQQSACAQWLASVELEVLEKGYVILMPLGDGQSSEPPSAEHAVLARTNAHGTIVSIDEGEIQGEVPTGPERAVPFEPDAIYACFWTRSADLAEHVWQDVQDSPARALEQHLFSSFVVTDDPLRALPEMMRLGERARTKLAMLLPRQATREAPGHGVVSGLRLAGFGVERVETNATYVIGRSEALAATFLAGLFPNGVADTVRQDANDWLTIEGTLDIVHSGVSGVRLQAIDADLHRMDDPAVPSGSWNEVYWRYAFDCASARVPRTTFWMAIDMLARDQAAWQDAAERILKDHKVRHPSYSSARFRPDWFPRKDAIMRYFDLYDFAFANQNEAWIKNFEVAKSALAHQGERARVLVANLLDARGRYDRFMMELGAHVADNDTRTALHDQYLTLAVQSCHEWWHDLPPPHDDAGWARFVEYGKWITTLSSKLGDLMKAHFGEPLKMASYNKLLAERAEAFEKLFGNLQNYDRHFAGEKVRRKFENVTFEADFDKHVVTIREKGKDAQTIRPMHLLVEVEQVPHTETTKLPPLKGSRQARYKQVVRTTPVGRATIPSLPFKGIRNWPLWLSAFGETIGLAFQLRDVSEQWREASDPSTASSESVVSKALIAGEVASGVFQAVDSVSAALNTILRRSTPLMEFLGHVGIAGNVLEAITNVGEGMLIMFEKDDGAIARARERGDAAEVFVRKCRGVAYIASALPGPVALVIPKAIAAEVLASGLAAFAIFVIGLDIFLYSHSGPGDAMSGTAESLKGALQRELGERNEGRTTHNVSAMLDELQRLVTVSA
jgi:hypothetical protein